MFCSQVDESSRSPEPRLKTLEGTRVWLSMKQEKTPFSMMLECYVSQNIVPCGTRITVIKEQFKDLYFFFYPNSAPSHTWNRQ